MNESEWKLGEDYDAARKFGNRNEEEKCKSMKLSLN
jgi:hypothetical protein